MTAPPRSSSDLLRGNGQGRRERLDRRRLRLALPGALLEPRVRRAVDAAPDLQLQLAQADGQPQRLQRRIFWIDVHERERFDAKHGSEGRDEPRMRLRSGPLPVPQVLLPLQALNTSRNLRLRQASSATKLSEQTRPQPHRAHLPRSLRCCRPATTVVKTGPTQQRWDDA